jgi:hypothetical protein
MVCIFCGHDRKRSREDVFPKWLHPLFPPLGEGEYLRRLVTLSSDEEHRRPASSTFDVIVRDICEPCNNGWMSQLENRVKPILAPMLLDQPRGLTADEQHLLATWATKTALTMQGANIGGKRFTPATEYRWFHDHVAPLPNAHVWLCRYGGQGNWPLSVHQWGMTVQPPGAPVPQPGDPMNGYSVVFAIGPVVFWLWGHDLTGGPYTEAHSGDAHVLIWPALGSDVHWPPRHTFEAEAELQALSHRLPAGVAPRGLAEMAPRLPHLVRSARS